MRFLLWVVYLSLALVALGGAPPATAQGAAAGGAAPALVADGPETVDGLHVVVSRAERKLWLKDGEIVLHTAPVAVGKPVVLEYDGREWDFTTPAGRRVVIAKEADPVWVPPDWHYVELAVAQGWELVRIRAGVPIQSADGGRIVVRGDQVGRLSADGTFRAVPPGEEVVVGDTLFIPPVNSANRRIPGELGQYKLNLGNGYYFHGTRLASTVGTASTHGCLRLHEQDLAFLYRHVPVGTPVLID